MVLQGVCASTQQQGPGQIAGRASKSTNSRKQARKHWNSAAEAMCILHRYVNTHSACIFSGNSWASYNYYCSIGSNQSTCAQLLRPHSTRQCNHLNLAFTCFVSQTLVPNDSPHDAMRFFAHYCQVAHTDFRLYFLNRPFLVVGFAHAIPETI